ncbi:uncharacterized protein ALTATR162_LOCUS8837 [Alternaria atra]|uniref:Beta-lactamase-related domain-containing protein n=1 Tax=Alternaria atra TaxID=119953 RepID=A0A8J2N317_9PLEO|nr:uncharacterized protein ALTATR162_LOCUS8837 [Alternaria atra]CAG5178710.1 unnamed protein product [Alternaria atra]
MKYINSQTRLLPFRGQFSYKNLAYEQADKIIESLSGQSFSDFVQERIFNPLGMNRTFLKTPPSELDDIGTTYNALDDGASAPITAVKVGDDWLGRPHAGMRSCISDLEKLYSALVFYFNDQFEKGTTSTGHLPLKQVTQLMSAEIPMDQPSRNEASYSFDWGRVQFPRRMGQIGINPDLLTDGMPVVGKGVPSQLVIFHQRSLSGALSIVMLLPESETTIVISTNALALNDVANWMGQIVLEEFLQVPDTERNDYVELAKISRAENLKWYPALIQQLGQEWKDDTLVKPLDEYVGTYWNDLHIFKVDVKLENGQLYWLLQGLESEEFSLNHYEDDSFTWLQPHNEVSRRGRWVECDQGPDFWKAVFKGGEDGKINKLF